MLQSYKDSDVRNLRKIKYSHDHITFSHNGRSDEDEESDQAENQGGICCKVQGWIVVEDHKGGKNQEDEEIGSGMFPDCGRE